MKNLITLLLVFVASQHTLQAQAYKPFIKTGAYWDEFSAFGGSISLCPTGVQYGDRYFFKEDSIINGSKYTKRVKSVINGDLSFPFFC